MLTRDEFVQQVSRAFRPVIKPQDDEIKADAETAIMDHDKAQRARIAELEAQKNKMRATLKQAITFYEAGLELSETNFREWAKFAEESIKERE